MITVHHLNNSRSQRVLWLLEELGVPYELRRYERDRKTMLAPTNCGSSQSSPILPAITAKSSSDKTESWRVLAIGVPRGYCAETRLQDGRVRPCLLYTSPSPRD